MTPWRIRTRRSRTTSFRCRSSLNPFNVRCMAGCPDWGQRRLIGSVSIKTDNQISWFEWTWGVQFVPERRAGIIRIYLSLNANFTYPLAEYLLYMSSIVSWQVLFQRGIPCWSWILHASGGLFLLGPIFAAHFSLCLYNIPHFCIRCLLVLRSGFNLYICQDSENQISCGLENICGTD